MLREILVIHHTHTDIGYTHDQPIVWELNRQFIDEMLEEIDRTEDWDAGSRPIWTCEVTETLRHWLRTAGSAQIDRFKRAVCAGRMSAGAMPYNLTPMVGVPEFIRALAQLPELRRTLGLKFNVAINHDINGLPWTMIPLLLDAGVEMVIMGINVHFGGFPLQRPLFFKWIGPDGRGIVALNGEHYGMFQRFARVNENSLEAMAEGLARYEQKLAGQNYPHDFAYLSLTHHSFWDNNPPYTAAYELIRRWNADGHTPHIRFITPDELLEKATAMTLPGYTGDWTDYWNFGAGSSAHETRLAHEARSALFSADVVSLQRAPTRDNIVPQVMRQAYESLALWDEHTWGNHASIGNPDRDSVGAGWHHKAYSAYRAQALARYVLAEQLETLAGNPRHAQQVEGVLIFNPTPFERSDYVRLPRDLVEGRYEHLSSTAHLFSEAISSENTPDLAGVDATPPTALFGPVDVPAYGYIRLPLAALARQEADGLKAEDGQIESPTHRIGFHPATGAIHSLFDLRSGHEIADRASAWPMLSLIHETVDGPVNTPSRARERLLNLDDAEFQDTSFVANWAAQRTLEQTTSLRTRREAHRVGLEVCASLPGASEIVKRIWLYAHTDVITIDIALRKSDVWTPDAIYLALPLNLPCWDAVFDTMGTPTLLDIEQVPGCCRDWVTVSGYVDVHDNRGGVTLACPDMPLAMVGGFAFGQRQLSIDRSHRPLLLAWLINNYWTTNFRVSQPGFLRFHYELATHSGFDAVNAARVAAFARSPLLAHPAVAVSRPEIGTLIDVDGNGIVIAAAERLDDGARVWLQNLTDSPHNATVHLGQWKLRSAALCDTFGREGAALKVKNEGVTLTVPARGVTGLRLTS
jgi:alpha-mannosidase